MTRRGDYARAARNTGGFTLVELLVVIAIVGILAAIAIPQFAQHRARAHNASAMADSQTIRTAEHALFAEAQQYGSTAGTGCTGDPICTGTFTFGVAGVTPVALRPGTALEAIGTLTSFTAATKSERGDRAYCVDSDSSAIQYAQAAISTPLGAPFRAPLATTGANDCVASYPNIQ
jgi:prepilin-type N-terminal cleavage/methylation domain-containing protein